MIRKHEVLPIFERGKCLFIAISDHTNLPALLDDIRFYTKKNIEPVVVEADKLAKVIEWALEVLFDTRDLGDVYNYVDLVDESVGSTNFEVTRALAEPQRATALGEFTALFDDLSMALDLDEADEAMAPLGSVPPPPPSSRPAKTSATPAAMTSKPAPPQTSTEFPEMLFYGLIPVTETARDLVLPVGEALTTWVVETFAGSGSI